jgi:hypothetical protein
MTMGGSGSEMNTRRAALAGALALCACLFAASSAAADTFKPTRLDDPTPGKCKPDDCSLREAIRASNNHNGRDEVRLGQGTYEIQIPTNGDLSNDAGDFNVNDAAVIRGRGANQTSIDANGIDRVLFVLASGATVVEGLTVEGGDAGVEPSHSSDGGGIIALADKLTLNHVVIRDNEAVLGGGLLVLGEVARQGQHDLRERGRRGGRRPPSGDLPPARHGYSHVDHLRQLRLEGRGHPGGRLP